MANYDIDTLHQRILNILTAVDDTCRRHHLTYYIWAGTMLGAVRHKGFIPWDDDIDIAMPRPDYERLIAHSREWLPAPMEFVCAENDSRYPLPFGKVQDASTTLIERFHLWYLGGVYIDVFPIDGAPGSRWRQRLHFGRYEWLKRVLYLLHRDPYRHGHGPSSWVPLLCRRCFTMAGVQRSIRRMLLRYSYDDAPLVADYDDGLHGIMDKRLLGKPTPVTFAGHTVMGVEQADRYLRQKYGDYMVLPKDTQRRQHNFHYLDLSQPYRAYRAGEGGR